MSCRRCRLGGSLEHYDPVLEVGVSPLGATRPGSAGGPCGVRRRVSGSGSRNEGIGLQTTGQRPSDLGAWLPTGVSIRVLEVVAQRRLHSPPASSTPSKPCSSSPTEDRSPHSRSLPATATTGSPSLARFRRTPAAGVRLLCSQPTARDPPRHSEPPTQPVAATAHLTEVALGDDALFEGGPRLPPFRRPEAPWAQSELQEKTECAAHARTFVRVS